MIERWDVVDQDRRPLGKTHVRGEQLAAGTYHTVIEVFTFDVNGNVLLSQRHPDKTYPLLWEGTGGSVLAGETSRDGAVRELREEIGLSVEAEQLEWVATLRRATYFLDLYRYQTDAPLQLDELILQEDEVVAVRLVDWSELIAMDDLVPSVRERLLRFESDLRPTL